MTEIKISIERAIKRLLFIKEYELQPADKLSFAAINMAIQALEKQIPKRVNKASENKLNTNLCPVCSREVIIRQFYCETCGQKLNWD